MQKGIDYVGVGIGAVILSNDGKVFLAKRGKEARNEVGKWECPGGSVKFGDTMEQTIIREMQEEFGIIVQVIGQLGALDHLLPDEKQHWVAIAYLCVITGGVPIIREPEKCSEIGWFTPAEMEQMELSLPTKFRLKELQQYITTLK